MAPQPTREAEVIAHDDECPVCQNLVFDPVKTQCNHVLCASCMAQWASTSAPNVEVELEPALEQPLDPNDDLPDDIDEVRASCPMCRTNTTVSKHTQLHAELEEKYPVTYAQRRAEEEADQIGQDGVEGMTILIGNLHHLEPNEDEEDTSGNIHDWTFFVRVSRPEVVESVRIDLHPTFRPPHVVITKPPYQINRLGWGTFELEATIKLKHNYKWVSDSTNAGRPLKMNWMLAFEDPGLQRRIKTKIRREGGRSGLRSGRPRRRIAAP